MSRRPPTNEPFVVEPRHSTSGLRLPPWTWGVGGLLVGVLLTFLILLFFVAQPPAAAPQKPNPVTVGDLSVVMDDAFLTRILNAEVAGGNAGLPITNLQAEIQPNEQIVITGDVSLFAGVATRRFSADAQVSVQNGHLLVHLTNATVGGFVAPAVFTTPIENQVNSKLGSLTTSTLAGSTHLQATYVSTTLHKLTVGFTAA